MVRVRPVRVVLDVSPAQHAELAQLCLDLTAALGAGRLSRPGPAQVCGQDVLRALLRRALADETARAQLLEDLMTS